MTKKFDFIAGKIEFEPFVGTILTPDQIKFLKELEAPWVPSHISFGSHESSYVEKAETGNFDNYTSWVKDRNGERNFRNGSNKAITSAMISDINASLEKPFVPMYLSVIDTNYLRYEKGDFLRKHPDTHALNNQNNEVRELDNNYLDNIQNSEELAAAAFAARQISCITMVDVSEDLEGGTLCVYDGGPHNDYGNKLEFRLSVGETVFFPAKRFHECTEIVNGHREVLVSWMGQIYK